jgi:hypothetical protein
VPAEVNHQDVEVLLKFSGLLEPDRRTSASTVHKNYPFLVGSKFVSPVMQHWLSNLGTTQIRSTTPAKGPYHTAKQTR